MLNSTDTSYRAPLTAAKSTQSGNMKKISRLSRALKIYGAICFAAAAAATAMADQLIIESYVGSTHNTDPSYTQIPNSTAVWSGSGSSAKSTAPGLTATRSTFSIT